MSDEGLSDLSAVAMELVTSALGQEDVPKFMAYARTVLDEALEDQEDAYTLISVLAYFAAQAVESWSRDTDREPDAMMQKIALERSMYTGEDE